MKMKAILLVLVLLSAPCLASERTKMTQGFSGETEASDLLESIARSASSGDFSGFMKFFTSKYASGIRRKMKAAISGCEVDMEIIDNKIQSCDEKTINMRAKYSWDNGSEKTVFTSDLVAKMEDGSWRIASESVVNAKKADRPSVEFNFGGGGQVVFSNDEDILPIGAPRMPGGGCAGGRCGIPPGPQAQPVNQGPRPIFDILPIGAPRMSGGGCAGGRCGL